MIQWSIHCTAAHMLDRACAPFRVMDTPGAALSVLPQMDDRGSAGNAVILYSMQHNAQNPSCIDLFISR
jgi:hypothetical protein